MVEKSTKPIALAYTVEEQFLCSKTGHEEDNEDAFYVGPYFVAVIDGATSKSKRRWNGETSGRMVAQLVKQTFAQIPSDATMREAVDLLTSALKHRYEKCGLLEKARSKPEQRATASFVALSLTRKELWMLGDCQCLLDQEWVTNTKLVDEINANARSLYLEAELCRGRTIEELLQEDTGRAYIMPLLKRQMLFQNNPEAGQYWYPVLDGFEVPEPGLRVLSIPDNIETIVLASDGYPVLKDTLEASEEALQEILRDDPLLFRKYKSTKGIKGKNVSFDDRAYVKLRLRNT